MTIRYVSGVLEEYAPVSALYHALGWDGLGLSASELETMCRQSWFVLFAFDGDRLAGMGRVISDGVITGIICGLGVHPEYRSLGIGRELLHRLTAQCEEHGVIPQLMCAEQLVPYYEASGFKTFTVGMSKRDKR